MKRPLSLLALILTTAVLIYLQFCLSDITGREPGCGDGDLITIVGQVQGKEFRKSFSGEILPVIYLFPKEQNISDDHLIQCYLDSADSLPSIGQYVRVSGKVKAFQAPTNPGEFDSRLYYSTLKISYRLSGSKVLACGGDPDNYRESLFRIRMFFEHVLDECLSSEDSAIMKAMLLGDKAYMDSEIKDMYKDSGIIHILAVSGLHISIIGMGIYELLRRFSLWAASRVERAAWRRTVARTHTVIRKPKAARNTADVCTNIVPTVVAIAFMYSYGIMCGMGTSSFRAICMFTIRLMAPVVGRTYDILSALSLAEILLLLDQPLYLYNSGFLFSFGAVLGITVIKPLLVRSRRLAGCEDMQMKFVEDEDCKGVLCAWLKERRATSATSTDNSGEKWWLEVLDHFVESDVYRTVVDVFDIHGRVLGLLDGAVSCLAVTIVTLPVYACFYYAFPLHSLVLNLVVIPVMGILMLAGIVCMILGAGFLLLGVAISPGVGLPLLANTSDVGAGTILSSRVLGADFSMPLLIKLPGGVVHGILAIYRWLCSGSSVRSTFTWYMGHSDKWQVALYVTLIVIFILVSKSLQWEVVREHINNMFLADVIRGVVLVIALVVLTYHRVPDLEISMIDVGQGDGIVISSAGNNILIDGGSTSKKNVGKYQIIPFLKYKGIEKLDAVVVTHEDEDHISGIFEIMDDMEKGGIRIKQLILPEVADSSRGDNYHELEQRARNLGISIAYINEGESFGLGKVQFTCLNPELGMTSDGANAYSTVLFMEYMVGDRKWSNCNHADAFSGGENSSQRFTALFTGDVEGAGQDYLKSVIRSAPEKYANLSLLKVAHHGSQYTTDEEFLDLTKPLFAIISCGRDNSYGHPHEALLERLYEVGTTVYRTDKGGCISVVVQGKKKLMTCFVP